MNRIMNYFKSLHAELMSVLVIAVIVAFSSCSNKPADTTFLNNASGSEVKNIGIDSIDAFKKNDDLEKEVDNDNGNDVVLKMAEKVYKDSHYYRYKKGEDFPTCPVAYVMSPDSNYLYVVTRVYANSNGWTSEYQLQRYNLRTGRQKLITECAGITTDSKGIKVVDCRLVNEDENPGTADEIWMMHDVYYKWNGTKVFNDTSNEYDFDTFGKKYLNKDISYCYVTGMTFFPNDFVQSVW